jgi:hypothetical protein
MNSAKPGNKPGNQERYKQQAPRLRTVSSVVAPYLPLPAPSLAPGTGVRQSYYAVPTVKRDDDDYGIAVKGASGTRTVSHWQQIPRSPKRCVSQCADCDRLSARRRRGGETTEQAPVGAGTLSRWRAIRVAAPEDAADPLLRSVR